MTAPRVSVMVPAYNAEDTVAAAVRSALSQTFADLEVVVVDDGSRVPVEDALEDFRADGRVRIVRHPRNRGLPSARNSAVRHSRGALISQLDADDTWDPEYLEAVVPCFERPEVGLAYTNARVIGGPVERIIPDASVHPMDRFPKIAEQCPIPALTATMRTEAVRAVGGYNRFLWGTEDYHIYLKLAAAGWRFAYVDRELATYRWPSAESGMSHDTRRLERDELRMWALFFLRHPGLPGPRRQLRTRVPRELRRLAGRTA